MSRMLQASYRHARSNRLREIGMRALSESRARHAASQPIGKAVEGRGRGQELPDLQRPGHQLSRSALTHGTAFRLDPATSPAGHLNHRFEPERGGWFPPGSHAGVPARRRSQHPRVGLGSRAGLRSIDENLRDRAVFEPADAAGIGLAHTRTGRANGLSDP
jgi:hypothetical protein